MEDFVIEGAERYNIVAIWARRSRGSPGENLLPPGKIFEIEVL